VLQGAASPVFKSESMSYNGTEQRIVYPVYPNSSIVKDCVMNIEGTYTLQAQPGEVWRCLLDPQVLQQTVPGARRIEQVDEYTCSVIVNVKQGTYQGQMTLSEQEYPYQCHVTVNGEGRQVAFDGSGDITLSEQ